MPDEPEVCGLLALMLLHDSRRAARLRDGELVLLADQDRALWDGAQIEAGRAALRARAGAARAAGVGVYALQAAIASLHAEEPRDWPQIAALYGELARLTRSPVVELNRAVALAEARGPRGGLRRSKRSTGSTATTICMPPAPSCCAVSAAAATPARHTSGRSSSCAPSPSGGFCAPAGLALAGRSVLQKGDAPCACAGHRLFFA